MSIKISLNDQFQAKNNEIFIDSDSLVKLSNKNNLDINNINENIIKTLHLAEHKHKSFAFNSADLANRGWLQTIIDSSHLITFCISISVIIYGSFRSLNIDKENSQKSNKNQSHLNSSVYFNNNNSNNDKNNDNFIDPNQTTSQQNVQTINTTQALFIPFAASISLLIMFFFFDSIQTVFVICTSVLATVAFSFLLTPVCRMITKTCYPQILNKKISCCFIGRYFTFEVFAFLISINIVGLWIVTGHWLLMDLIGIGFCVTFIAIVRLPSLKVSTLLLAGLVIYDVLWVYFSHIIFNSNVMVKVATKEADNPVSLIAKKLNINSPFGKNSPKLSLPGKLIIPSAQTGNISILGLGDIVIPGLLLCFVLRFDAYKRSQLYQIIVSEESSNKPKDNFINHSVDCDCLDCKLNDHNNSLSDKTLNKNYLNENTNNNKQMKFQHSYPFLFNSQFQQFTNRSDNSDNNFTSKNVYSMKNIIKFNKISYFHCTLIGYFVGLITASLSSEIFRHAQPALLFLVPFTLLPLLMMAYLKGDLKSMWNDPFVYSSPIYYYV